MYIKHLCIFFLLCNISSIVDAGSMLSYQLQAESCSGNCFQLKRTAWPNVHPFPRSAWIQKLVWFGRWQAVIQRQDILASVGDNSKGISWDICCDCAFAKQFNFSLPHSTFFTYLQGNSHKTAKLWRHTFLHENFMQGWLKGGVMNHKGLFSGTETYFGLSC